MSGIIIYIEVERKVVAIKGKSNLDGRSKLWPQFAAEIRKQGVNADGWGITEFIDRGEFEHDISEYELMMPVVGDISPEAPLFAKTIPGGKVAAVLHRGPFNEIGRVHREIQIWVQQHGFQVGGRTREYHLRCPHNTSDEKGYVTEIQVPIR
ncbi:GyrI-like domain-containing protein [bacterium]|nr:GyrI-like domain-containing protein [bacterium]